MDIDTQPQTHPNPQPNPHHRKIDLQSPHDLTYLQIALAKSAQQKLDLHFPKLSKPATHISLDPRPKDTASNVNKTGPSTTSTKENDNYIDEDDDPMRRRVQDLIHAFLTSTWQSASHNIAVNGIDASSIPIPHTATLGSAPTLDTTSSDSQPPSSTTDEIEGLHFNYAPFDPALQHRLASLHGELEALTAQVSRLRRTAPSVGAETYQQRLAEAMDEDDRLYGEQVKRLEQEEVDGVELQSVRAGWNEDVREMYEHGVGELATLAGVGGQQGRQGVPSLTETVGKAQRARRVASEFE